MLHLISGLFHWELRLQNWTLEDVFRSQRRKKAPASFHGWYVPPCTGFDVINEAKRWFSKMIYVYHKIIQYKTISHIELFSHLNKASY